MPGLSILASPSTGWTTPIILVVDPSCCLVKVPFQLEGLPVNIKGETGLCGLSILMPLLILPPMV